MGGIDFDGEHVDYQETILREKFCEQCDVSTCLLDFDFEFCDLAKAFAEAEIRKQMAEDEKNETHVITW